MIEFVNQLINFFPLRHEGTKLKSTQRFSASKIKQPATTYQQRATSNQQRATSNQQRVTSNEHQISSHLSDLYVLISFFFISK